MVLKGRKPELIEPGKPKFMISGRSGIGKTYFATMFPNAYLIDTEGGATRKQFAKNLITNGGYYMGKEEGSQDFSTVIREIKALSTEKHDRKTLVIDSFSKLYLMAAAIAEAEYGNDFGKDKKEANKPTRQLMLAIEKLDMAVIFICHGKDKWSHDGKKMERDGTTFDGYDKMEFDLDLWLEMQLIGKARQFVVKKTRIESFPLYSTFPATYEEFSRRYGVEIMEREAEPIVLASKEEVEKLKRLMLTVKMEDAALQKWYNKAGTTVIEEMSKDTVVKCIEFYNKKLKGE